MRTRFVIRVAGRPQNLFSVRTLANSADPSKTDLNIHFSPGGRVFRGESLDTLVRPPPEEEYLDAHIHFSVHASTRSRETNSIHREVLIGGKSRSDSVLLTTAIKKDDLFAPIMFVVCGDMKSGRSDVPPGDQSEQIELAEVNTDTDQYRFMVVLARAGRTFTNPTDPMLHHPSRLFQRTFGDYEIIVISSYFNHPAQPHTIDLVPFTTRDTGPQRGLEWWEVYNLYTDFYAMYASGYFDQIYQPQAPSNPL